jgi:hypothetical protein
MDPARSTPELSSLFVGSGHLVIVDVMFTTLLEPPFTKAFEMSAPTSA